MLHFPSVQAPSWLKSPGTSPAGHLQSRTGRAGSHAAVPVAGTPRKAAAYRDSVSYASGDAPDRLLTSTRMPGPMVEDSETRFT